MRDAIGLVLCSLSLVFRQEKVERSCRWKTFEMMSDDRYAKVVISATLALLITNFIGGNRVSRDHARARWSVTARSVAGAFGHTSESINWDVCYTSCIALSQLTSAASIVHWFWPHIWPPRPQSRSRIADTRETCRPITRQAWSGKNKIWSTRFLLFRRIIYFNFRLEFLIYCVFVYHLLHAHKITISFTKTNSRKVVDVSEISEWGWGLG